MRHLHANEKVYKFWDYFRNAYGRNAGLRIDHLLLGSGSGSYGDNSAASIFFNSKEVS